MKGLMLSLFLFSTSVVALENSYRLEFTNQKTGEVKIFKPTMNQYVVPMGFKDKKMICVFGESESKTIYNKTIAMGMLQCGRGITVLLSSRNMPTQFLLQDGKISKEDPLNGLYFVSAIVE